MNTVQCIILIVLILLVLNQIFHVVKEDFSVESNCKPELIYPNSIAKLDRNKVFMLRDIKTNYWLIVDGGVGKFVPGRFGKTFSLPENPNEYLPLRTESDPNIYMLADYSGSGMRAVSNPYNNFFKLEILIYNERNILAWEDEASNQHYIIVDDSGYMESTTDPDKASQFEMVFVM